MKQTSCEKLGIFHITNMKHHIGDAQTLCQLQIRLQWL